jgi:hypothetical protein
MNRREMLAAGIGLGSVAITSATSLACCGGDEPKNDASTKVYSKDAAAGGTTYCPMFPYMFCGSYSMYYAVPKDNNGICTGLPATMAGPNGMACGCSGSCVVVGTFLADAPPPILFNKYLEQRGIKKFPFRKIVFAPGAGSLTQGLGGQPGLLVSFKDKSMAIRYAHLFQVDLTIKDVDSDLLTDLGIDATKLTNDGKFYVGHEEKLLNNDMLDADFNTCKGVDVGSNGHIYKVTAPVDGTNHDFTVVMKR